MAAPALAERVGRFVKQAVDVLPFPWRVDLSTLPLGVRWARAENLSPDKKIAFVAREVKTLLNSLGDEVEEKKYTYSTERVGQLVVTQQKIEESQLSPEIKSYILNPPVDIPSYYSEWPTTDPTLELSTTDTQQTRYHGPTTQFAIGLELISSEKNLFRFGVAGETRKKGNYMNVWISPSWTDSSMKAGELWRTEAYQNYRSLVKVGYTQDSFAVARELVRFAHEVIEARRQTPTPAAA